MPNASRALARWASVIAPPTCRMMVVSTVPSSAYPTKPRKSGMMSKIHRKVEQAQGEGGAHLKRRVGITHGVIGGDKILEKRDLPGDALNLGPEASFDLGFILLKFSLSLLRGFGDPLARQLFRPIEGRGAAFTVERRIGRLGLALNLGQRLFTLAAAENQAVDCVAHDISLPEQSNPVSDEMCVELAKS
jgi:hypothetical protein